MYARSLLVAVLSTAFIVGNFLACAHEMRAASPKKERQYMLCRSVPQMSGVMCVEVFKEDFGDSPPKLL